MVRTLSRMLLAGIFIAGGFDAFAKPGGRVDKVASSGIPEPEQAVKLNGAAMVIGGAALALNIAPKAAAVLLIGSLIPTTFAGHPFWKESEQAARKTPQVQFIKHRGLIAGLVLVLMEETK